MNLLLVEMTTPIISRRPAIIAAMAGETQVKYA